ncbi:MAG: type III-B CRISPR module RAMP protein Cmr1 [Deltaproteobacteria bacterium]
MNKASFELEVVTPLFLGDADGKPELRPPSIRGAMRFWFRAMMGGVLFSKYKDEELIKKLAEKDEELIKKLAEKEAEIWGTTEASSKVTVLVSSRFNSDRDSKDFRPNQKEKGLRYLGYGLGEKGRERRYIPQGTKFRVDLVFRRATEDEKKLIVQSFWLLINLGNLGSRSRKGFGGLKVAENMTEYETNFKNCSNAKELKEYIQSEPGAILEHFSKFVGINVSQPKEEPPFSMIFPKFQDFWPYVVVNQTKPQSTEALNWIGEHLRNFREDKEKGEFKRSSFSYYVTKDYDDVKKFLTSDKSTGLNAPKGSIFGLPHQFQFQSMGKKVMITGQEHDRRASPLHIKIFQCGKDFIPFVHIMRARFLSEGETLQFMDMDKKTKGNSSKNPSYSYLYEFLNTLP